jgi:hypothetical protein
VGEEGPCQSTSLSHTSPATTIMYPALLYSHTHHLGFLMHCLTQKYLFIAHIKWHWYISIAGWCHTPRWDEYEQFLYFTFQFHLCLHTIFSVIYKWLHCAAHITHNPGYLSFTYVLHDVPAQYRLYAAMGMSSLNYVWLSFIAKYICTIIIDEPIAHQIHTILTTQWHSFD